MAVPVKVNGRKIREYNSWCNMKYRCCNPNHAAYHKYGGRGITICPTWISDFQQFYKDMGPRPIGTTLDRIDNDLGYSKENCRWATYVEQSNNRKYCNKEQPNKSGFTGVNGVRFDHRSDRWVSSIFLHGKCKQVYSGHSFSEAKLARNVAQIVKEVLL